MVLSPLTQSATWWCLLSPLSQSLNKVRLTQSAMPTGLVGMESLTGSLSQFLKIKSQNSQYFGKNCTILEHWLLNNIIMHVMNHSLLSWGWVLDLSAEREKKSVIKSCLFLLAIATIMMTLIKDQPMKNRCNSEINQSRLCTHSQLLNYFRFLNPFP